MTYILAFIFGSCLGSFANAVADRLRVRPIVSARSECESCGKKLSAWELFPILSYLIQRGRCRSCGVKLSPMYLYSEILAGLAALLAYIVSMSLPYSSNINLLIFLTSCVVICASMVIMIYDLRHKVVPVEAVFILMGLGVIVTAVRQYALGFNIYDALAGVIVALPFTLLYVVSRGKWLGLGDILLYFAFGALLGLPFGVTTFLYSVWLGAFVSILLMLVHRKDYNLKSEIPFTPFIIIAAFLVWFTQTDLLNLYVSLY